MMISYHEFEVLIAVVLIELVIIFFSVDPTDPKIVYDWFEVGVLDYDHKDKCYLVQKVNSQGRVVDGSGKPVVNGGVQADGNKNPGIHSLILKTRKMCSFEMKLFAIVDQCLIFIPISTVINFFVLMKVPAWSSRASTGFIV